MDEYTSRLFNESRWICFNVDPWKAFFNPSFGTSAFHVVITAYATGAAVIASIAGFKLLKKNLSTREIAYHKRATIRLVVTFITGATMWLSGHESAIALHKHSPEKLASAEALFETTSHAPLSIGGVVDPNTLELNYALEIPNMLSLLVGLDPSTVVKGLKEFPQETWPPFYTHTLFNLMVGTAAFTFAVAAIALILVLRLPKREQNYRSGYFGGCRMRTNYDARY